MVSYTKEEWEEKYSMTDTEILNWLDAHIADVHGDEKFITGIDWWQTYDDGELITTTGQSLRDCVEKANTKCL